MDALHGIQRVSLGVQSLAATLMVVLPAYHLLSWFVFDDWLQRDLAGRGLNVPVEAIGAPELLLAFAAQTLPLLLILLVLYWIHRLFGCYRRGQVFEMGTIRRFRSLAHTLFVYCLVNPLSGAAMSLIVTARQPPGQRMLVIGFGTPELAALIAGGVLAAIGWVMVEAKRLADENAQIV